MLLQLLMNNQYRSIIVVVRLKHHSALVIIIFGVNICGLSYTKLEKIKILNKNLPKKINDKKKEIESNNSLPQECSDVFWLHMCIEREKTHESLAFFFLSFLFLSLIPSIYQKVWFDGRIFFFFFSSACVVFSSFELGSGGSYSLHIYINDNLGHRACVRGMPDRR
jgi:hypothetical protein